MATATKTTGSQFDGLLAPRKRPQPEEPEAAPVGTDDTAPTSRVSVAKSKAKSLAKSKNDAYQGRTFYVRKKTYAECDYVLKSNDDPRDMSDLAEELLSTWLINEAKRSAR
ncbi:hypothetical protein [Granulicella tundricola]|uniref:Uncharacterized protein n=1 Tax=Granulicella tundricola (strain ATCC BAA-1859 / DSM 23138 / MP5ACTX9) TaxID=1198114 RepID=E8X7Q0_GRATM|nr:hypothetical protein [Granulicella tundricola]ADW71484.1 hypothetical protein AciX9_4549 [Granulicella tundricola MP5ACTX9]